MREMLVWVGALASLGLLACSSSGGSTGTDAATAADTATTDTATTDTATPSEGGGDTATTTDAGDVRSCVALLDTCSEFHGVPAGDVAAICSSAEVKSAPCTRASAVGGCRRDHTVGFYIVWVYNDGTGLATAETVRKSCVEDMPPGTFVAP